MTHKTILMLLSLFCVLATGCKVVPVQMARVSLIDNYKHWYIFPKEEIAEGITKLIGQQNWETLIKHYPGVDPLQDIQDKKIMVYGTLITTLSLVPTDQDKFFIEGFGKYYLINTTDKESLILFSADFNIVDYYVDDAKKSRSIQGLKQAKKVVIETKQYMIRHFGAKELHYFHDVPLKFRMYLKTVKGDSDLLSFDYGKHHELILDNKVVGLIEFQQPPAGEDSKLIDLRGTQFLRGDY